MQHEPARAWPPGFVERNFGGARIAVRTWALDVDDEASLHLHAASLDTNELCRMQAFHHPQDAWRFAAAHCGLRQALAGWRGVTARQLRIAARPDGKPWLPDHPQAHFNLSHAAGYAILALGSVAVGVDIEKVLEPAHCTPELANQVLTHREAAYLRGLDAVERAERFTELWVCKESVLKANGVGLRLSPQTVEINIGAVRTDQDFYVAELLGHVWGVSIIPAPLGYRAALCFAYPSLGSDNRHTALRRL